MGRKGNTNPVPRKKIEASSLQGERLRYLRDLNQWSQIEAAAEIDDKIRALSDGKTNRGCSVSTYQEWEYGRRRIAGTVIKAVADVFGVRPEYLRGEDDFINEEEYKTAVALHQRKARTAVAIVNIKQARGKMIDAIITSRGITNRYTGEEEFPAEYLINGKWYSLNLEKANSLYEQVSAYLAFLITQEGEATGNNGND